LTPHQDLADLGVATIRPGRKSDCEGKIRYFCKMKNRSISLQFRELNELGEVATQLLDLGRSVHVWLFHGDMGVGKTTLIKEICGQLGVQNTVQSPTFSIINEYITSQKQRLFHFDFYRLKNEEEAYDIGTEEYIYSGDFCFIEWPEKIESLWPDTYLAITVRREEDQTRSLDATII
jgi:tRNA threonylcarbamoyladenosine biosynthesis protein TsaE